MYYQDTDPTHLNYDGVDKVVERFTQTYDQELVGEGLGNFHVDLVWMVQLVKFMVLRVYFLGKRNIHRYFRTDKYGNTINSEHIRCRGIPTFCIQYQAGQDKITALGIYKSLYKGEVIEFGSTNDLTTFVCRNNKDHAVSNVTKYTRTAGFFRDGNDKLWFTNPSFLFWLYNGSYYKRSL